MRKYPEKYLEILKNETIEIENNGVKIIVKPSPGEEREGYLDPCEKAIMEGHWASKTADNNQQQKEEASVDEIIDGNLANVAINKNLAGFIGKRPPIYTNMSFVYDRENLLNLKDSPTDKGEVIFKKLVEKRRQV